MSFNDAENLLSHAKELNVFFKPRIKYNAAVTFLMQLSVN